MPGPSILLGPIIGGLSHDRANIWARADSPAVLHVWLATHPDLHDARLVGKVELPAADGCAGILPVEHLEPETKYYYAVSLEASQPARDQFHAFTTFPKPGEQRSFAFAFGSCYLPPDEHGGETMDRLYGQIGIDDLRFGLFLGDQIYAEAAARNGLGRIAVTLEEYRAVYEYAWSRPVMRRLLPNLPLFMIIDDHEVDDDWAWRDPEHRSARIAPHTHFFRWLRGLPPEQRGLSPERVLAALKAYHEHQGLHRPAMGLPLHDGESFAYTFSCGGAAFFVLDTRTLRVRGRERSLLGEQQWARLEAWLKEVNDRYPVKFLVSSGNILHPFWLDIFPDRWNGFPAERERLLEFLAVNEIEGLHIVTGDLHAAHVISARLRSPSGRQIPIWEFCTGPFEQDLPLATATYHPVFSKWIGSQNRLLRQRARNFGVIRVDFDSPAPHVTFTLHYQREGWKTISVPNQPE